MHRVTLVLEGAWIGVTADASAFERIWRDGSAAFGGSEVASLPKTNMAALELPGTGRQGLFTSDFVAAGFVVKGCRAESTNSIP